MVKIGEIYRKLVDRDFKVLNAIEKGMARYEYVPLEVIEKYTGIPESHLELSLSKLHRLKLVKRQYLMYKGFRLTYLGLDMLSLKYFVDKGVLEAIGDRMAVGKESEIFRALAPGNKMVVVKFLRIGRPSFRGTRKLRVFAVDPHLDWYRQSKIAAEREFKALRELYYAKANIPKPISYNRHTIILDYIEGVELYRKPPLENPVEILEIILETIRKAFLEVGIVHGDLSEYNVLIDVRTNKPVIIDWPQYVEKDNPSSSFLLERDIEYIVKFFNKNYGTNIDVRRALAYVKGESQSL